MSAKEICLLSSLDSEVSSPPPCPAVPASALSWVRPSSLSPTAAPLRPQSSLSLDLPPCHPGAPLSFLFALDFSVLAPSSVSSPLRTLPLPAPLGPGPPLQFPPPPAPRSPPSGRRAGRGLEAQVEGAQFLGGGGAKGESGRDAARRRGGASSLPSCSPSPRSHRTINQGQCGLANGRETRKSACQAQPMRGGVKSSAVSAWPMKGPGLTINLPVRDSGRERECARARAGRVGAREGGSGGARGAGGGGASGKGGEGRAGACVRPAGGTGRWSETKKPRESASEAARELGSGGRLTEIKRQRQTPSRSGARRAPRHA